jgi:hypothetical protein
MITSQQINWVAGILEGEGYFGYHAGSPVLVCNMTDRDVLEKLQLYTGYGSLSKPQSSRYPGAKLIYTLACYGKKAAGLMMTLYILMGPRRQSAIEESLDQWKVKRQRGGRRIIP